MKLKTFSWALICIALFQSFKVWAMGPFLIPLVMGVTISTGMGVSSYCEIESCGSMADKTVSSVEVAPAPNATSSQRLNATLRLPTTTDPALTAAAVPPPAAAPTAAMTGVDMSGRTCARCGTDGCGSWESCNACFVWVGDVVGRTCIDTQSNQVYDAAAVASMPPASCPAGYSSSNGSCVLQSAQAATPDNNHDVPLTPSGYLPMTPGAEADSMPTYTKVENGKVTTYGVTAAGEPVVLEVAKNGTQTTITKAVQTEVAGQSVVRTTTLTINGTNGGVVSSSSSGVPGALTTDGTGTGPGGAVTGIPGSVPSTGNGTEFPSDYARAGEAAAAANTVKGAVDGVKSSVDGIKDKLSNSEGVTDPTVPGWTDSWGSTFGAIKGWSLPSHTSTCPTSSFEFNNQIFTIDTHCELVQNYFGVLESAMAVVWVIVSLFVVLGA